MTVMVIHVHSRLANKIFGPDKLEKFYDWFAQHCRDHEVDVVMGDFNMCMYELVPVVRNRGLRIDVAAYYPWKLGTEPQQRPATIHGCSICSDSCAAFIINANVSVTSNKPRSLLHDSDNADDEVGIFCTTWRRIDVRDGDSRKRLWQLRDRVQPWGPGYPMHTYLPKPKKLSTAARTGTGGQSEALPHAVQRSPSRNGGHGIDGAVYGERSCV